ncbi:MAG: hypothetical protein O3C40_25395 [Planctomycetota bacterium]|nr:hypothetical protein [Planctomycetota bacterium]
MESDGSDAPVGAGIGLLKHLESALRDESTRKEAFRSLWQLVLHGLRSPPKEFSAVCVAVNVIQAEIERDPEAQKICAEIESARQAFFDHIRNNLESVHDDFRKEGLEPPQNIDQWEHWSRIIERDWTGMKLGDLHAEIMAWLDRKKIEKFVELRVSQQLAGADNSPASAPGQWPTVEALHRIADASDDLAQQVLEHYPVSSEASPATLPFAPLGLTQIRAALQRLAECFDSPDPAAERIANQRPDSITLVFNWPRGWSESVALPLHSIRDLFTSLNTHFVGPAWLKPDVWVHGKRKPAIGTQLPLEVNGHLPAEWIKSLQRSTALLRNALQECGFFKEGQGQTAGLAPSGQKLLPSPLASPQSGERIEVVAPDQKPRKPLPLAREKAYRWCCWAIEQDPGPASHEDRDVHDFLLNHPESCDEIPKKFSTFRTYVSEARKHFDRLKHNPRSGRNYGGSVASENRI